MIANYDMLMEMMKRYKQGIDVSMIKMTDGDMSVVLKNKVIKNQ